MNVIYFVKILTKSCLILSPFGQHLFKSLPNTHSIKLPMYDYSVKFGNHRLL